MKSLIEQAKGIFTRIHGGGFSWLSMLFVYIFITVSLIPIFLYLGVWGWVAIVGGGYPPLLPLLQDMRQFVGTIFSTQVIAGIMTFITLLVDDNHDGKPDVIEADIERKKGDKL